MATIEIIKVRSSQDMKRFISVQYALNAVEPGWIAPLKSEVSALLNAKINPWFEHGKAAFFYSNQKW